MKASLLGIDLERDDFSPHHPLESVQHDSRVQAIEWI